MTTNKEGPLSTVNNCTLQTHHTNQLQQVSDYRLITIHFGTIVFCSKIWLIQSGMILSNSASSSCASEVKTVFTSSKTMHLCRCSSRLRTHLVFTKLLMQTVTNQKMKTDEIMSCHMHLLKHGSTNYHVRKNK